MALLCNGKLALPAVALSSDDPAVIAALEEVMAKMIPKNKAPAALRVIFHDAGTYDMASGTGGANGSVGFELTRPESFGLNRGFRPIEKMPAMLVGTAAEGISLADLTAYAGAYAVRITGGPVIKVAFGRQDVTSADPEGRMPAETLNAVELKAHFQKMGFSAQELVAISGAHTIGGKGFGEMYVFDNTYYTTLIDTPWKTGKTQEEKEMAAMIGLPSDKMLPEDDECLEWIKLYASDQAAFFRDFEKAYIKLANLNTILA